MDLKRYCFLLMLGVLLVSSAHAANDSTYAPPRQADGKIAAKFSKDPESTRVEQLQEIARLSLTLTGDANNSEYSLEYNEEGLISLVRYKDLSTVIQLRYLNGSDGTVNEIQFVIQEFEATGVNPAAAQAMAAEFTYSIHVNQGPGAVGGGDTPLSSIPGLSPDQPNFGSPDAGSLPQFTFGRPIRLSFQIYLDRSNFDRLLQSLQKNKQPGASENAPDFQSVGKTLAQFKGNKNKSIRRYLTQTQPYYDKLSVMLREDLAPSMAGTEAAPDAPQLANIPAGDREAIDRQVTEILKDSVGPDKLGQSLGRISKLQPVLEEMYITPNRQKLQKTLEDEVDSMRKKLHELLILRGKTSMVENIKDSTEILLILPPRSN